MDDKNFDKIFEDKLKQGKEFPFSDDKWEKMETKLNNLQAEGRHKQLLTWLTIPLLAMFGSLALLGWTLHDARQDIRTLTEQVKVLSNSIQEEHHEQQTVTMAPSVGTVAKGDTVYHHSVVYHFDTIFQTVVRRELPTVIVQQHDSNTSDSKDSLMKSSSKIVVLESKNEVLKKQNKDTFELHLRHQILADSTLNSQVRIDTSHFFATLAVQNMDTTTNKTLLKEEDNISSDTVLVEKLTEAFEKALEKRSRRHAPILHPMRVDGYELGISGGIAAFDGRQILRQDGFTGSIRSGLRLGDHLKLIAEAQYLALDYDIQRTSKRLDVPTITPPMPNDSLTQVRVQQPYWYYALGLQYSFGNRGFKPFIGASLLGQSKLEEKFEYKFKNSTTQEEVIVESHRSESKFQAPLLRLHLGVEYPFYKNIKAQMEGSYDVNVSNVLAFKPLWQLKTGFLYRF